MKLLPKIFPSQRPPRDRRAELEQELIRMEARIGGQMFGPQPRGRDREFFCLDEHTWVWYEEWMDEQGQRQSTTTRYDVRPNGVLKLQEGHDYQRLSRKEAHNLYRAAELYRERVGAEYQRLLNA